MAALIPMFESIQSPADATYWMLSGRLLYLAISILGLACFAYIVARRLVPLLRAERDLRFDRPWARLGNVFQFWLGQWRHPRYRAAGTIHLLIFAGFILLIARAFYLILSGIFGEFSLPGVSGRWVHTYSIAADYAAAVVFFAVLIAALRRLVLRPARYAHPPHYGKGRAADAVFLLLLIAILMAADGLYEASRAVALAEAPAFLTLPWMISFPLQSASVPVLATLYQGAFLIHELTFFFLLCYRPFGIQFHVETSLFSIFFAKLERHSLKPVRWGVPEEQLTRVPSFGVKRFEDFTWKHMLDFYSCADCGRCSDQCPANAVKRPLSPRFFTTKARDYCFRHYPVAGASSNGQPLVGTVYSEDEIWSCTTCGACEEECPLLIEYIDKIVDLRRGRVDAGRVPQSLQKPLKALESRGNPFGKMEKKRADWAKAREFAETCAVKIANGGPPADTLYFVDSITSYDDRLQAVARATARILAHTGENFAILGPAEKDSGHDVRRFGEEMLFMALRDQNRETIEAAGVRRIVTADPHAFNALKHDYTGLPPVEHISQTISRAIEAGRLALHPVPDPDAVYVYHDPCYLGRHNGVYDAPRDVLDSIPGLKRAEMRKCRSRSFCCGGGGLALFYESKEEQRMGVLRVRMAAEAGASVIVTACPFCMVNIEDAIKVAGMEETIAVIDMAELVDQRIARESRQVVQLKS